MKNQEKNGGRYDFNLPEAVLTLEGTEIHPRNNIWQVGSLSSVLTFDFTELEKTSNTNFLNEFKYVLCWYLEYHSAPYAYNLFRRCYHFLSSLPVEKLPISKIDAIDLINYRETLDPRTAWYLGHLRPLCMKWSELGMSAVAENVPNFFKQIRIKGNIKGEPVRTMDPETGPFTDLELQSITTCLNAEFADGNVAMDCYLLVVLTIVFGVRPIQLASLKVKDLTVFRDTVGTHVYTLNMPRAKQRNSLSRDHFKKRALISEIGEVLETWIDGMAREFESDNVPTEDLPIFPFRGNPMSPQFEFHSAGSQLSSMIIRTCNRLNVLSARTGERLKINPRRFRYTLGTRAAEEGHGELIIADLLDHSDTQNVGVYVEASPAIAERIDKATALELAPIAQAFMGLVVLDEDHAKRGKDPTSRIGNPDLGNVGSCGKYGFCGGMAPIACYTCRNFQPWLDAPHESLLDSLIAERERILELTNDDRMAAVNDHTIVAVAEVVNRCKAIKSEKSAENG